MKNFLKYLGIWIFAVGLLAQLLSMGCLWALRKSAFYKPSFLANQVTETHFDYLILGASTGLTTLNTKIIDSLVGTVGINLAMDDTGLPSHYLMLKHFLVTGKTAKYCIIVPVLNTLDIVNNTQSDNDYRFLMFNNTSYVQDYYETLAPKNGWNVLNYSAQLPFIGVSYYNVELFFPAFYSFIKPNSRNRFDSKGNYSYNHLGMPVKELTTYEKRVDFKNPYIQKIEELCAQHGIRPIYYLAPHIIEKAVYSENQRFIINHSNILKNPDYFYDAMHVNKKGNREASRRFAHVFQSYLKDLN